jgi:hypothetical protein
LIKLLLSAPFPGILYLASAELMEKGAQKRMSRSKQKEICVLPLHALASR